MKLDQRGFTIVELLVGIAILAVVAPLLATGMFQILTSTERGRAGFEAQADTRNAAAWMSQDIVMAQVAYDDYDSIKDLIIPLGCDGTTFRATFTWTDWFGDPDPALAPKHSVFYCLIYNSLNKENQLVRFYDCKNPVVIGRHMDLVVFEVTAIDPAKPLAGQEVTIDINSLPARNRFQVDDKKTVQVKMRPMPAYPDPAPVLCP